MNNLKYWQHTGSQFAAAFGPMSADAAIYAFSIYGTDERLYYYSIFDVNTNDGKVLTVSLISDVSGLDNDNITSGLRHYQNARFSDRGSMEFYLQTYGEKGLFLFIEQELKHKGRYNIAGMVVMASGSPGEASVYYSYIAKGYRGKRLVHNLLDFLTGPVTFSNFEIGYKVLTENLVVGDDEIVVGENKR